MLTPQSLRIGNLLRERNSGDVVKVVGLSTTNIVVSGHFRGTWQAEPIPITQEWLEKFGFELKGFEWKRFFYNVEMIFRFNAGYTYAEISGIYLGDKIKHIHELQNLIYCLTGQELTIKQS